MELCIFDETDPNWIIKTVPMTQDAHGVWSGKSRKLAPGRRYGVRVSGPAGPMNSFHPEKTLIEPYSRGLVRVGADQWQSSVVDGRFDWAGAEKPRIPLDHAVVYEAHVRGISKLNRAVPTELRGTYAGLAHASTIGYLKDLGVTSIELLPVQAFVSEQRLLGQGLVNYWGYNTLNFFSPHADYATRAAQSAGPEAVLREFKGMVKLLHEAGLEVILDVVYNHTSEEGPDGPVTGYRGIDNAAYYRQTRDGRYLDVTGCGNTVNFGHDVPVRLVLDSLRYWAERAADRRIPVRPRGDARPERRRALPARPSAAHRYPGRPGPRRHQAHRRAVGRRAGRLADRQLPGRLDRMERPLPRPDALVLADRHRCVRAG